MNTPDPVSRSRAPSMSLLAGAPIGGSLAVVAAWVCGLLGYTMPGEVAAAMGSVFSFAVGYLITGGRSGEPG